MEFMLGPLVEDFPSNLAFVSPGGSGAGRKDDVRFDGDLAAEITELEAHSGGLFRGVDVRSLDISRNTECPLQWDDVLRRHTPPLLDSLRSFADGSGNGCLAASRLQQDRFTSRQILWSHGARLYKLRFSASSAASRHLDDAGNTSNPCRIKGRMARSKKRQFVPTEEDIARAVDMRQRRKDAGFTLSKLAALVGVTAQALSQLELAKNRPSVATYEKLVKVTDAARLKVGPAQGSAGAAEVASGGYMELIANATGPHARIDVFDESEETFLKLHKMYLSLAPDIRLQIRMLIFTLGSLKDPSYQEYERAQERFNATRDVFKKAGGNKGGE